MNCSIVLFEVQILNSNYRFVFGRLIFLVNILISSRSSVYEAFFKIQKLYFLQYYLTHAYRQKGLSLMKLLSGVVSYVCFLL